VKPVTNIDDPRFVKALSHPLRVRILAMLQERTASPVELSEWLGSRLGTVAYHVRTLHHLGLIELVDETRVRGAVAHHYRAKERPKVSGEAWEQASPMAKQAAVGASLQTIDEYARASAAAGGFDRPDTHLTRLRMDLDAEGWRALSEACGELFARAEQIEAAARERIAGDPHAPGVTPAALVIMNFEALRLTDQPPPAGERRGGAAAARSRASERALTA
jgi:DNA-binding transcriptional ArsR family regulator